MRISSVAVRYGEGTTFTAFVPLCSGDEVVSVSLQRTHREQGAPRETLWQLEADGTFGDAQWFVVGADRPGQFEDADPALSERVQEDPTASLGVVAETESGRTFDTWFGLTGTRTDGNIPRDGSMTTGTIDPIAGDEASLARFEREQCDEDTGLALTKVGRWAVLSLGAALLLIVAGSVWLQRRAKRRSSA